MKPEFPGHRDRRRHPRRVIRRPLPVELRFVVGGDAPAMLLTGGLIADLSAGGLRCDIDLDIPIGTRVDVRFPELPRAALGPELVAGRVVRVDTLGGVPDSIAIEFARPLEVLDFDRLDPAPALADASRISSPTTPC